jgi:hypothetical protein
MRWTARLRESERERETEEYMKEREERKADTERERQRERERVGEKRARACAATCYACSHRRVVRAPANANTQRSVMRVLPLLPLPVLPESAVVWVLNALIQYFHFINNKKHANT